MNMLMIIKYTSTIEVIYVVQHFVTVCEKCFINFTYNQKDLLRYDLNYRLVYSFFHVEK